MSTEFVAAATLDEIPQGTCKALTLNGIRVVVAHLADGLHAVENRCSHANSPLLTGKIYHGRQIACPIHGARFDLKTGAAKSPPAFTSLMVFPVRVTDGQVEVGVPETNLA
jgi:3-phenylpropionate/trans-cinnamate dioxygenase ferredoxin component